jgi:hypothetical protein
VERVVVRGRCGAAQGLALCSGTLMMIIETAAACLKFQPKNVKRNDDNLGGCKCHRARASEKIGRCHTTVTTRSEMTRGHPSTRRNIYYKIS